MSATWRRHWKIPLGMLALVVSLVLLGGQMRVIAYVGAGGGTETGSTDAGVDHSNDVELLDDSVAHTIQSEVDESALETAVTVYQQTGEKEYFLADITIDGVTITDVGVRIKGNSTLQTALQSGADPDEIPYLVKLDEYNSGVSYQSFSEMALRTEGPRGDEMILEETVTADVLEVAGLPFPETSYTGLSINGEPETLRVVVELLDNGYVDRLYDGDGVLYKAQSGDSFTYLGHDPTLYEGAFTQETATNEMDLEPLLDFLEFIDTANDEEFEAELEDWLDVDSFVSYVVVNNLLASVDSMPGNGNNYYLWYDSGDDRFTVLAWDLNESFGGFWMGSSGLSTELLPDWSNLTDSAGAVGGDGAAGVGLGEPPDGAGFPEGGPPEGAPPEGGPPHGGVGLGAGGAGGLTFDYNNPLVERFLATDSFLAAYEERYGDLYEILMAGDGVNELIVEYSTLLTESNTDRQFVADAELESAVSAKLQWVAERTAFLGNLIEG